MVAVGAMSYSDSQLGACARRVCPTQSRAPVFDKGRRPGGRVSTRRSGGVQFDHGAQFFTARDPRFAAVVQRLERDGAVAPWAGPFTTLEAGTRGADPRPGAIRYVGVPGMSGMVRALAGGVEVRSGVRVERVLRGEYDPNFTAEMMAKDISLGLDLGARYGVPQPFNAAVLARYRD